MKPSPLSFQQSLLVAFLIIGSLLGATALRALFSLESLMAQSRAGAAQALALSTSVQALSERSVAAERAARQSLVLGDRLLRQRFEEAAHQARDILQRLDRHGLPPASGAAWRTQLDDITAHLDGPPDTALEREREVARGFRALDGHSTAIAQQVQALIQERHDALQDDLERSRAQIARQVGLSIGLAAALALAFGVWLARPFRRLECAVQDLGLNRLEPPIHIPGPADVRRLGQQLDWLRLRLTELDEDKARFLRHVSHELKTPLASLHEGVAVLGDGVAGPLNTDQAEVIRILRHNTELLQAQIEALLRFNAAAFQARQLRREPTDLRTLVETQVEAQRLNWQARRLRLRLEGPSLVLPLDREQMASALANLLRNAIRFSPEGGTVRLVWRVADGRVQLDIQDEGPGVAPQDAGRIFEPFYRGERQPEHAPRGTGIGLSIVQEVVHAHGGRIALQAAAHGAHFRLEWPHAT